MKKNEHVGNDQAGFSVNAWCSQVGISRATFYTLPANSRPQKVKIGDRTIIFEQPFDWLARMARDGGVVIK